MSPADFLSDRARCATSVEDGDPIPDCAGAAQGHAPHVARLAGGAGEIRAWFDDSVEGDDRVDRIVVEPVVGDRCGGPLFLAEGEEATSMEVVTTPTGAEVFWNGPGRSAVAVFDASVNLVRETTLDDGSDAFDFAQWVVLGESMRLSLTNPQGERSGVARVWDDSGLVGELEIPDAFAPRAARRGSHLAVVWGTDAVPGLRFFEVTEGAVAPAGPIVEFAPKGSPVIGPHVALDGLDGAVVVWHRYNDPTYLEVWAARVALDGTITHPARLLGAGLQPLVVASDSMTAVVHPNRDGVAGPRYCGQWLDAEFLVPGTLDVAHRTPQLAGAPGSGSFSVSIDDDELLVGSTIIRAGGDRPIVYFCGSPMFSRLSPDGSILSEEIPTREDP